MHRPCQKLAANSMAIIRLLLELARRHISFNYRMMHAFTLSFMSLCWSSRWDSMCNVVIFLQAVWLWLMMWLNQRKYLINVTTVKANWSYCLSSKASLHWQIRGWVIKSSLLVFLITSLRASWISLGKVLIGSRRYITGRREGKKREWWLSKPLRLHSNKGVMKLLSQGEALQLHNWRQL